MCFVFVGYGIRLSGVLWRLLKFLFDYRYLTYYMWFLLSCTYSLVTTSLALHILMFSVGRLIILGLVFAIVYRLFYSISS